MTAEQRAPSFIGFVGDDVAFIAGRIELPVKSRAELVGSNSERT
jgi:hypothetical protein